MGVCLRWCKNCIMRHRFYAGTVFFLVSRKGQVQIGGLLVALVNSEQNKPNPSLTACFLCEL